MNAPVDYQFLMQQQDRNANYRDMDPAFIPLFHECRLFTMTSVERLYDLYKSVEFIVKAGIPGVFVECGVWRGGAMMMVAKTLLSLGATGRQLQLYDTFEGHPKGLDEKLDVDIFGSVAAAEWYEGWGAVPVDEVRDNLSSTTYPMEHIQLVKGRVEKTLYSNAPHEIALARLDTDWYESAKIELEILWPRIVRGGFLIIDDYGHYKGQRQAVDEYFKDQPVKLTRIDYSCRVVQKL